MKTGKPQPFIPTTTSDLVAALLMELGSLQVFCYQTKKEFARKAPYKEVYWKEKGKYEVHGPFTSIYQACSHYSWAIQQKRIENKTIHVDFKNKRRL